jgi:hypothetical protein
MIEVRIQIETTAAGTVITFPQPDQHGEPMEVCYSGAIFAACLDRLHGPRCKVRIADGAAATAPIADLERDYILVRPEIIRALSDQGWFFCARCETATEMDRRQCGWTCRICGEQEVELHVPKSSHGSTESRPTGKG